MPEATRQVRTAADGVLGTADGGGPGGWGGMGGMGGRGGTGGPNPAPGAGRGSPAAG
ncbi:hypothetical protein GCM10009560_15480 [Nonomuraea longicatena]|uniref:Uncharacterized protein n=1 Tax=Nonomuraea longicatena TaxID=83682 RepID=A0ABP3ZDW2_9ACTN